MIVTDEHLEVLAEAISPLDTEVLRTVYRKGEFPRADKVQDLNKRYRWDLLWAARQYTAKTLVARVMDEGHYNNGHLDTALRRIVPPLKEVTA